MSRSRIQRDLDDFDSVDRLMRGRVSVDLSADASGAGRITSRPVQPVASDGYSYTSPNRKVSDGRMRSRRFGRKRR